MIIGVDVETANPNSGAICALGIAIVIKGAVVRERHWLYDPLTGFDARYIRIHGITERNVRGRPTLKRGWSEVLAFILEARRDLNEPSLFQDAPLHDAPMYVAHNAPFDRGQIQSALGETLPFHLECTVSMARKSFPQLGAHKLNVVAAHLGIPLQHHDALSDARACALIAHHCTRA